MQQDKERLLQWIKRDREKLLNLAGDLIRAQSPKPPGETRAVAERIAAGLDAEGLAFTVCTPDQKRPNIVASFSGGANGRTLVLNGHMDVLPVAESEAWTHDPWSGVVHGGKIWGRGATNMKCGLAIALSVYIYLHRMRGSIAGSLTFSAVSDEIVLGGGGTAYLMDRAPEILGDACLIAEPSGLPTIRFGEKGPIRLRFRVRSNGGHGAFAHLGEGAIRSAGRLMQDLESLREMACPTPKDVDAALCDASVATDETQGPGASGIVRQVTVTIAQIEGGIAKNMIPAECRFVADIRVPLGLKQRDVMNRIEEIVARYSDTGFEVLDSNPPAWSDPYGELPAIIRANVKYLTGFDPVPAVSLGCTDARLWRYRGIPCYTYGPPPTGMGGVDEHVDVEDFMHAMRTHALTAYDYLAGG